MSAVRTQWQETGTRAIGPCLTGCAEFDDGRCTVCGWPDGWQEKEKKQDTGPSFGSAI